MKTSAKNHLITRLALALIVQLAGLSAWASIVTSSALLPQQQYVSPTTWHALYANGIYVKDFWHGEFTAGFAPPTPGQSDTHSFGSTGRFKASTDGGLSWADFWAPAPATVSIAWDYADLDGTQHYKTEMTALDAGGGSLPPGFMIRESPSKSSAGETTFKDLGDGMYRISSFFDIWTEISIDGGVNWSSAEDPIRMELVPEPSTWYGGFLLLAVALSAFRRVRR